MMITNKYKPTATPNLLLFLAGSVWIAAGTMLVSLAYSWLSTAVGIHTYLFATGGVTVALLAHHFGFLKIADKNLKRILLMRGKQCLFAFMPWKSYLIIPVMVTMGAVLRHSAIPKHYLAVFYIGMGLALILSSVRYIRTFIAESIRAR